LNHLGLAGFSALHAGSSKEGLAVLRKNDVALILLDINMPEIDGFQTIELLRMHPQNSGYSCTVSYQSRSSIS